MRLSSILRPRAVSAAALVLACASAASAQERPAEFESWIVPGWSFTPSVSVAGMWDSNVALAASQGGAARSDRLFTIDPQGQLNYLSTRTDFVAGYRGHVRHYADLNELNGYDQQGFMSLRRLVSKRVTLMVANGFSEVPTTDEIELSGIPYARTGSRSNRFSASLDSRLTKYDDFGLRYENTWVDFDDETTVLRGGVVNGVRADYGRRLSERTTLGAEYRVRHSSVNDGTRQLWFNDFGGVFRQSLDAHTVASVAAGYSRLQDDLLEDARGGAYLRAEINRRQERADFGVGYERAFAPTFGFGGSSQNHEVRGYVRMPFSRNRVYLQSTASWRRSQPLIETALDLESYNFENTLGHTVARWLRVEAFHAFSRQETRVGAIVKRHRAGAQVVVFQPMRIR